MEEPSEAFPFFQPEDGLPPQEVRFKDLHVEPWPGGQRIRVHIELTPFLQPPCLEVAAENAAGDEIAHVSIIETILPKLVFTMHLRTQQLEGPFTLFARVYYPDLDTVDSREIPFQPLDADAGQN